MSRLLELRPFALLKPARGRRLKRVGENPVLCIGNLRRSNGFEYIVNVAGREFFVRVEDVQSNTLWQDRMYRTRG